ncbi:MAG: hypothetical protein HYV60_23185 [Planctomycetia bacterium]|nr:hypothetical protein [Planctomycetia bacterium]
MSHARLTFIVAPLVAILVSGCAGSGWFAPAEFATLGQRRAMEQEDKLPAAPSTANGDASAAASGAEPTLSQVLDDLERIKYRNPSDFKVIQSAIEDTSSLFPPQYQQLYKDQMQGVALSQQEQSPQTFPQLAGTPAIKQHQVSALRESFVQAPDLTSAVALTPSQVPMSSDVAPTSYATDVTPTAPRSTSAVLQTAATTAHVGDMPTQVSSVVTPQAPMTTAPAEITTDKTAATVQEMFEPGRWNQEIERALASLDADLARPNLNRDEKARLEIMRRLLYVVTNRRDEAVAPIDQLDEDEQEYWKHQLHGLLVSTDADGQHPTTRRAALALRHLRTATDHLANVSTLDVGHLTFCKEVLSYGDYRVFDSYSFRAKDQVVMYVEIDNFAAHPRGDSFETELHSSYEIVDDAGRRVANVVLPVDKQVSNNRRRDYFIAYLITMPSQIAPGAYRLQLTVEDVIGKKSNHAAIDFRIQ